MNFNNPIFWSFIVALCSIALLTEAARLMHMLFVTRQTLKWYLLLIVPLTLSIWSFYVAWYTSNKWEYHSLVPHIHITTTIYDEKAAPLILACQLQTAITIIVFAILLFGESIVVTRINQPPVWTVAKEHLLTGNSSKSTLYF